MTNLAARLCAAAAAGEILVAQRVFSAVEHVADGRPVGELELKGFSRPIRTFAVTGPLPATHDGAREVGS